MIDASIPLQVKPPVVQDPIDAVGRILTLRGLAQQGQIGQQHLQEGALKLQEARKTIADSDAADQIFAKGGTTDQTIADLNAAGLQKHATAFAAQTRADATAKLTQEKTALEVQSVKTKRFGDILSTVTDEPSYLRAVAQAVREGVGLTPEQTHGMVGQPYNPQEVDQLRQMAIGAEAVQKNKIADAEAGIKANAEARAVALSGPELAAKTAEAGIKTADAAQVARPVLDAAGKPVLGPDGQPKMQGMTDKERQALDQTAKRDNNTAVNEGIIRSQRAQQIGIEGGRLAVEKARYGFEASGGVSAAAQMAADGKMDPATLKAMLRTNPGLINQIKTVDPNFDEANIANRFSTLKEFTNTSNSKAGGQIIALNTLVHHADLYMQTAEALKNGTFKPGNAVYNAVADAFGSAPPQNAALVARFFAGETGKVATGGVPAEGEINGILKNLGTNSSPDQIKGAGQTLLQIAAGRATPLMERAKQAKIDKVVQIMGPDAQEILQRRGFDPNTMKLRGAAGPQGSGGASYTKTATGPNGHKIGSNDNGNTWVDIQTGQKVQ